MAVALLQGRIQELAAKIQRCISERGAAETVHCLALWVLVKENNMGLRMKRWRHTRILLLCCLATISFELAFAFGG